MRRVIQSILILALLSAIAVAQAPGPAAKVPGSGESSEPNQVYGGFVYEPTDWGPAWDKYFGFDFNYTRDVYKKFAVIGDFEYIRNNGSNPLDLDHGTSHNSSAYMYTAGPRYNLLKKSHRLQPYMAALLGGSHFTTIVPYPGRTSPLVQKDWVGFTYAAGGGVDFRVTNHFGVRGEWLHQGVPWGTETTDHSDWDRITFGGTFRW